MTGMSRIHGQLPRLHTDHAPKQSTIPGEPDLVGKNVLVAYEVV